MPEEKTRLIDFSNLAECGAVGAKPIINGGSAYFGAIDTYFYSINTETGMKNWAYKANGIILSTAALNDNILYFGCFDENLYALGIDGKLLWKFRTGGRIATSPAIKNSTIYVASSDNYLYAIDLKTHRELWKFMTGDEIVCDPLVYENRIYFGSMDSHIYCLDLKGNLIWKFKTGDAILVGKPVASDDIVYFGSGDQSFYAITLDGELVWKFVTGETVSNDIFVLGDTVYFGSRDRYIYAVNKKTGICKWKFMTEAGRPLTIVFDEYVYVASDKLYCLNMNGHKLWEFDPRGIFIAALNVTEKGCFFGAFDAKVYRISLSGHRIWDFRTNGSTPSLSTMKGVVQPPKWDPNRFDEKGKPVGLFNPYTLLKEGDELKKYMSGIDTTLEPYIGLPRDIGAYKDAGMEAAKSYISAGSNKKKKDPLEEFLGQQRRERPFGG